MLTFTTVVLDPDLCPQAQSHLHRDLCICPLPSLGPAVSYSFSPSFKYRNFWVSCMPWTFYWRAWVLRLSLQPWSSLLLGSKYSSASAVWLKRWMGIHLARHHMTLATWCEGLTHWKRLWCWESWGQKEKEAAEDEMVNSITESMDMNLSKLWKVMEDRGTWHAQCMGSQSQTWLSDYTTTEDWQWMYLLTPWIALWGLN